VTSRRNAGRKGNSALEFVLVGIPMIFVLISIFEIARGMWTYHTLAYAVREGVRYAVMHGQGCASPNTCQVTIGGISKVINYAGTGLDSNSVYLTFTPASGSASTDTMKNQMTSTTVWPPSGANSPGLAVTISAKYQFRTFLAVFWPGSGPPLNDSGSFWLPASSTEPIQF
jgi:Flp pilus assembly protein TadG